MRNDLAFSAIPSFPRGVRLRLDAARDKWVLLAPERIFEPDNVGLEILKRIDGKATFGDIVDDLSVAFDAPRERIEADVKEFLGGLAEKGLLEFSP